VLLTTGAGSIKVATYPTLEPMKTLHAHTSSCFCVELSPNGRYLATGGSDALICLWDTTDWICRRTLAGMVGSVRALGFSWDGAFVVGGSDEGNGLDIAHVETGEYVHAVATNAPAPCVAWHPSRYWLAYSGDAMGLKIVGAAGGVL
jgi:THO complex subunit 3